jgi:hypothetical protein
MERAALQQDLDRDPARRIRYRGPRPRSRPTGTAVLEASHPDPGTSITANGSQEAAFPPGSASRAAHGRADLANELSAALWDERRHLTELLYLLNKAASEADGQSDATVSATIEHKMQDVRTAGLARAFAAHALALRWGASEDPTLPEMILHAPAEPWDFIFSSHLDAMADLIGQIGRSRSAAGADPASPLPRDLRQFIPGR